MKEGLIKYETAKLLIDKKFPYFSYVSMDFSDSFHGGVSTPVCTQSVLQRWLREVHSIDVWAFPIKDLTFKSGKSYTYLILDAEPPKLKMLYATYELALESALLEGLKLIEL